MPEPIATWNPARGVWERAEWNMLCGHQVPFSETWPTSVSMRKGSLYPPLRPGLRTAGNGSSSSPGLLPTPRPQVGGGGASPDPLSRIRTPENPDGFSPNLMTVVSNLLPTPRTADGMNSTMEANRERMARHRSTGARAWRGTIEEAVSLLPTPNATDYKGAGQPPGRMRDGRERPASDADLPSAVSLLKTPTAQLAVNGGSQHPDKRREGGHGPTLADQVEHQLLPTPRVSGGSDIMSPPPSTLTGSHGLDLGPAIAALLPTPRVAATRTSRTAIMRSDSRSAPSLEQAMELAAGVVPRELESLEEAPASWRGEPTSSPSDAGSVSSDARPHVQLSLDELEND